MFSRFMTETRSGRECSQGSRDITVSDPKISDHFERRLSQLSMRTVPDPYGHSVRRPLRFDPLHDCLSGAPSPTSAGAASVSRNCTRSTPFQRSRHKVPAAGCRERPRLCPSASAEPPSGGAEGDRLEVGAVAAGAGTGGCGRCPPPRHRRAVGRQCEDGLGMSGAERSGPLDEVDEIGRRAAGGERGIDGQRLLGRAARPPGRAPLEESAELAQTAPAPPSGRRPWRGRRP